MNSPKELMNQLLYMVTSSDTNDGRKIKQLLDDSQGIGYKNVLLKLITGAVDYATATDTLMFDSYQDYLQKNALSTDETRRQIDYYEESTFLNLQDRDPEQTDDDTKYYSKMSEEEGLAIFGKEKIERIRKNKLHVEFYKLHHDINGKRFYNPVMTISIIGQKNKGFFQLNADVDLETLRPNGEYSVHFKTYVLKMRKDTKWASVQMSSANKSLLMRMIISVIPEGGRLSTWGTISVGGANALENLYKYVNENTGYIAKVGSRKLTRKETLHGTGPFKKENDVETSEIDVPIWEKDNKYAGLYKREDGYNPDENIGETKFPGKLNPASTQGKSYDEFIDYVSQQLIDYLGEYRNKYPSSSKPITEIYKEKLFSLVKNDADLRNAIVSIPNGQAVNYPFGEVLVVVQKTLQQQDATESSDPCL